MKWYNEEFEVPFRNTFHLPSIDMYGINSDSLLIHLAELVMMKIADISTGPSRS